MSREQDVRQGILGVLGRAPKGGITSPQIHSAIPGSWVEVISALSGLVEEGLVQRYDRKPYAIYWTSETGKYPSPEEVLAVAQQAAEMGVRPNGAIRVRTPLGTFALMMEARLQDNDHKTGWADEEVSWLVGEAQDKLQDWYHIYEASPRMAEAYDQNGDSYEELWRSGQIKKLVDAANFLMMAADNLAKGAIE